MDPANRKRGAPPEMTEEEKRAEAEKAKQISDRYRQLLREVQQHPEINTDPKFLVWIICSTFDED